MVTLSTISLVATNRHTNVYVNGVDFAFPGLLSVVGSHMLLHLKEIAESGGSGSETQGVSRIEFAQ